MTKSKMSITYAIVAALGLALSSSFITTALADSPHYLSATASVDSSGNLVCAFKEAGLGNALNNIQEKCTASASATYQCFNNGGNHPKAGNKETVTTPVSGSGNFPIRGGQTTGSITIAPPSAGSFSCPNGQHLVLVSVTYSGITMSDSVGTTTATTPSTASRTLFP